MKIVHKTNKLSDEICFFINVIVWGMGLQLIIVSILFTMVVLGYRCCLDVIELLYLPAVCWIADLMLGDLEQFGGAPFGIFALFLVAFLYALGIAILVRIGKKFIHRRKNSKQSE
ncbi:MAG: hypothetical protein RRY34_06660 [Victivallaceae bacterium]